MQEIQLILVDPNPTLCADWRRCFAHLPNVRVVNLPFELVDEYDCLVSPANSFGMMDGGVDGAIIRYFGNELMYRVQERILDEYRGEQPIGTSMIVETGHTKHPFLAHTPTMRIPMSIARTDYVYTAMWAMLLAVHQHNRTCTTDDQLIRTIACPGLGTGTGRVPYDEAARQMALAYMHYLAPPARIGWEYASDRQNAIRWGGDFGLLWGTKRSN